MSEEEKRLAKSFEELLSQLSDLDKERLIAFGNGMAFKSAQQQPTAPDGTQQT